MSTVEELLAIEDRDIQKVDIRGGSVYVRSLTVTEHMDMEAANAAANKEVPVLMANQLVAFACDESGNPIFNLEQAKLFVKKRRPDTIRKVIEAALDLNGMGKAAREEIQGNS